MTLVLQNDAMNAALGYLDRGWCPIPIPHGEKNPGRNGWQTITLTRDGILEEFAHERNIGIRLGAASGNLVDIDCDWREAAMIAPRLLPPTAAVFGRPSKPSSHRIYQTTEPPPPSRKFIDPLAVKDATIIEFRSQPNHQTVFPPSKHGESGETIVWELDETPETADGSELLKSVGRTAACALIARHWPAQGVRQDTALALAGALVRSFDRPVARAMMIAILHATDDDERQKRFTCFEQSAKKLDAGEQLVGWPRLSEFLGEPIVDKARDWCGLRDHIELIIAPRPAANGNGHTAPTTTRELTEKGNAHRLVDRHGDDIRHVSSWKRWLVNDGRRWKEDDSAETHRRALETIESIYDEAAATNNEKLKAALLAHAKKSETGKAIREALFIAGSLCAVTPAQLDRDLYVINVLNGTLDLRTATLRGHDPTDLITKLIPVQYHERAAAPRWEQFMLEIMAGCRDSVRTLQQWFGYCLSGDVSEEKLLFLYGAGSNGKSLLLKMQRAITGEYAIAAPKGLLELKREDAHPTQIARLFGARLAIANETAQGRRWNEQMVKDLTSRDTQSAHRMREDWWDFDPTHKITVFGNHKPGIRGTDNGIWRRLKLVPFTETFDETDPQSRALPGVLMGELPGILAWAVRGFLDWQQNGLVISDRIARATTEYRSEQDRIAAFLEDRCEVGDDFKERGSILFKALQEWCAENGERPGSLTEFGTSLQERGFPVRKIDGNKFRCGVRLRMS